MEPEEQCWFVHNWKVGEGWRRLRPDGSRDDRWGYATIRCKDGHVRQIAVDDVKDTREAAVARCCERIEERLKMLRKQIGVLEKRLAKAV